MANSSDAVHWRPQKDHPTAAGSSEARNSGCSEPLTRAGTATAAPLGKCYGTRLEAEPGRALIWRNCRAADRIPVSFWRLGFQNHSPGVYLSRINTERDSNSPMPLKMPIVTNVSMLASDPAEARGKSLAIAAVMSLSVFAPVRDQRSQQSRRSFPDDFTDQENGFVPFIRQRGRMGSGQHQRPASSR
jgi:hypothetical protein